MADNRNQIPGESGERLEAYRRNEDLESFLKEMEGLLSPVQERVSGGLGEPTWPVLLLVGNPRSGTTLFMQALASTGQFAVPSNLLSRFYYAPAIGAKIERLLTDPALDFKGELSDLQMARRFESDTGKTVGALQPNEFYYFWRRFLPSRAVRYMSESEKALCDFAGLARDMASIEKEFNKPLACKALMLQYNLGWVRHVLQRPLVVYIRRKPLYVMQSILLCRERFFGSREKWWSVEPAECEDLKRMDYYHQIAGQVYFTRKAIEGGLENLKDDEKMVVEYEDFCKSPHEIFKEIAARYSKFGFELECEKLAFPGSESGNVIRLDNKDVDNLSAAYEEFAGVRPTA